MVEKLLIHIMKNSGCIFLSKRIISLQVMVKHISAFNSSGFMNLICVVVFLLIFLPAKSQWIPLEGLKDKGIKVNVKYQNIGLNLYEIILF
ncbi:hypothetical protein BH23BAC1_BH23BAC1_25400 [soil metagenome]